MACEDWQTQLDAYLDAELPDEAMRRLDAHLRTCPACTADVLARVQLKRAIKSVGVRFTPSPQFRSRVYGQIAGKPQHSWGLGWALATAALAVVVVAGLLTSYFERRTTSRQQFYSELADLHVATLASANPVDVVSSDRHTVKPWFQGRIPFTFNLPDLQNTDFTLLGGRVTYLGQVPGAHLIYQVRKHQISVFIFPADITPAGEGPAESKTRAFNSRMWAQGGLRYVVFGDVAAEDVRKLGDLVKSAAQS